MKKLFALLIALMMIVSLVACGENTDTPSGSEGNNHGTSQTDNQGGNNGGENNGGDSYAIADVSADNWEKVIEENFGIKITLPDGWTIQSVASPNGYSNVKIFFVPGGSETYDSFGETLFAACKTASTQKDMEKASFADTAMAKGTCSWKYYPDIKLDDGQTVTYIQINYYDNGSNIEMTIQR